MNKLQKLASLLILLVFNALAEPPALDAALERWEIVTDLYIGVQTEKLTDDERARYGKSLPKRQGLRIKRVAPGSPAEEGGLLAGDIILDVNAACTTTMEELMLALRNTRPGELVHFGIMRDGVKRMVPVRVGALPEPVVIAYASRPGSRLPHVEAMAGNQRRIAELLRQETPDLQAIHGEFDVINSLFPEFGRPGQIRLYYKTDFGYLTVTDMPDGLVVTVQREQSSEVYRLRQQGDKLPTHVVGLFMGLRISHPCNGTSMLP